MVFFADVLGLGRFDSGGVLEFDNSIHKLDLSQGFSLIVTYRNNNKVTTKNLYWKNRAELE